MCRRRRLRRSCSTRSGRAAFSCAAASHEGDEPFRSRSWTLFTSIERARSLPVIVLPVDPVRGLAAGAVRVDELVAPQVAGLMAAGEDVVLGLDPGAARVAAQGVVDVDDVVVGVVGGGAVADHGARRVA